MREALTSVSMPRAIGVLSAILGAYGAPRKDDNAKWNVNVKAAEPKDFEGEWKDHTYHPSPQDWRQVPVYQLLTDRFYDADPTNNEQGFGGYDLRDHTMRHGGDFRGVMEKLDYIKGMGFKAVWISPVFQNEFNSYHGYAQVDFTLIDKRWGTLEDLRALTAAAHERDMYVIIDIVVNHMANRYMFENVETGVSIVNGTTPFEMHKREYKLKLRDDGPAGPAKQYEDFKESNNWHDKGLYPFNNEADGSGKSNGKPYYSWNGLADLDDGKSGEGGYWDSDFHHNGDLSSYADTFTNHMGKIYGLMDDVRTESPKVREKLIAMATSLIQSADIDGLRLDTPMQVELDFWKEYVPAIRKVAAEKLNKNNFGFWGELFCTPPRMGTMIGRGRAAESENMDKQYSSDGGDGKWIDEVRTFNGGIDYMYGIWSLGIMFFEQLEAASNDNKNFAGVDGVMKVYEHQKKYWDFHQPSINKDGYEQWTFCNNHDRERMAISNCGKEKMEMCNVMFLFWPGMYIYYAGDEQNYNNPGTALNGWAREELATSIAWLSISRDHNDDDFDMAHDQYKKVAKVIGLRKHYWPSLQCDEVHRRITPDPNAEAKGWGIFAWERSCKDSTKLLIVVNADPSFPQALEIKADVMGWDANVKVKELIKDEEHAFEKGELVVRMTHWGYGVFAQVDKPVLPPVVDKVLPHHDAVIQMGKEASLVMNFTFSEEMEPDSVHAQVGGSPLDVEDKGGSTGKDFKFKLPHGEKALPGGIHEVTIGKEAKSKAGKEMEVAFTTRLRVADGSASVLNDQLENGVDNTLIQVKMAEDGHTIAGATLHHNTPGAEYFRVRNALFEDDGGGWTPWQEYASLPDEINAETGMPGKKSEWPAFRASVPVIVQYYASGSGAYFKADCKMSKQTTCLVSWYPTMFWHGEDTVEAKTRWKMEPMMLIDNFVWEVIVDIWNRTDVKTAYDKKRSGEYKYNPKGDEKWSGGSYGIDKTEIDGFGKEQGLITVQRWMMERGRWPQGVGKLQREGGVLRYAYRCPEGGQPTRCTFRMSDFFLTFTECPETGICYMPGTELRPTDLPVEGDVCAVHTPGTGKPQKPMSPFGVLQFVFLSGGILACFVGGLFLYRRQTGSEDKPRQYTRYSGAGSAPPSVQSGIARNIEMNRPLGA